MQLSSLRTSARFTSLLLLLPAVLLCGCGGSDHASLTPAANTSDTTSGPVVSTSRSYNGLEFTISTPKATYTQGETVPLTFTVKNTGTQAATINYTTSPNEVQVSQGTQVVWTYSRQYGYVAGAVPPLSIAPGETKTYNTSWNQIGDETGVQVATGQYQAVGWLYGKSDPAYQVNLASNPITFTITN